MADAKLSADVLKNLEPICGLSEPRLRELAELCFVEKVKKGKEPFRGKGAARQLVYLLHGELALRNADGGTSVLVGGTTATTTPLGYGKALESAMALTDIEMLRVDDELLDLMTTWDELVDGRKKSAEGGIDGTPIRADWAIMSGIFSINSLTYGPFSQLPAAHIETLLARFEKIKARKGEVIIREGAQGDYYYLIESGQCAVERMIGGVSMRLAELKSGDAFGEEALVSEARRNATVTMKSDGSLLRLNQEDFLELLREPFLHKVSMDEARQRVATGGQWLDVRYPSEFQYDKLPGAINIPLSEIRNAIGVLEREKDYLVYCQSERRSSAAAFLLAQRGYRASVLAGGLWGSGDSVGN